MNLESQPFSRPSKTKPVQWFGSMIAASEYLVTGAYRPVLVLWTCGTTLLASELVAPQEAEKALRRTLVHALASEEQAPQILNIQSANLLDSIATIAPGIHIVVKSDSFATVIANDQMVAMPEIGRPATYLEAGLKASDISDFFSAMKSFAQADLLRQEQWDFISVSLPSLGLDNAILWVGSDAMVAHGWKLFPSPESFRSWMLVNVCCSHLWDKGDDQRSWAGTFRSKRSIDRSMQRECKTHKLALANPMSYPLMNAFDNEGIRRPSTQSDYLLATLLTQGVCKLRESLAAGTPNAASHTRITILHGDKSYSADFSYPAKEITEEDRKLGQKEY